MSRLNEIAKILSKDYPEGINEDEVVSMIKDVLPAIRDKLKKTFKDDKPSLLDGWNDVREDAEGMFEPLLSKYDMLKIVYIASKFKNNKNIGTAIVEMSNEL